MEPLNHAPDDSAADRDAHARVGSVLNDKWRLESLLGVGGMGAVYAGRHRNGARAAVKVLHAFLAKDERVRTRFLREGYAANRVEHQGVVKVLDDDVVVGGPDGGTAYLVMELLTGESLERRSRRGQALTERDFLVVAAAVLDVLEAAHRSGVVHRDIKPDNLFITRDGVGGDRVKVLDFGLARLLEGSAMTVFGMALGTPPFMSPEQAAGSNDDIDGRTDLFALAACGFKLLTGRRIHEGVSTLDVVQKMGRLAAPPIRSVAPQISFAMASVLDRALQFRREDRYESAAAMRADVERALAVVDASPHAHPSPLSEAPRDASIELSASDLQTVGSVELRGIGASKSIELSASDLEIVRSGARPILAPDDAKTTAFPARTPAPPVEIVQAPRGTQRMLAAPSGSASTPAGTRGATAVLQAPSPPDDPAIVIPGAPPRIDLPSKTRSRRVSTWVSTLPLPRSIGARVLLGVAVVGAGALVVAGWLALADPPAETSRSTAGAPSATPHAPARAPKPAKRPKH